MGIYLNPMTSNPEQLEETRRYFKTLLAGLHNLLLKRKPIEPDTLEIEFLKGTETEAEIYLPDFGINLSLWSRWSTEKRLEVLLHELAHVQNYDDNHRPAFWERVADLVEKVDANQIRVECLIGNRLNVGQLQDAVVKSVHADEVDKRMESVPQRKRQLRERFGSHIQTGSKKDGANVGDGE